MILVALRSRLRPERKAMYRAMGESQPAGEVPAIRPIPREEVERHIARAEALRHAAYAAAFAALGRRLRQIWLWTARSLRPNWLSSSAGGQPDGKCRA